MSTISLLLNVLICTVAAALIPDNNNRYCTESKEMIFEFPQLTGSYRVGTTTRHVVNDSRRDPYNTSDQRELMIRLWYPAKSGESHSLSPYLKEAVESAKLLNSFIGVSKEESRDLEMVYTHATPDLEVAVGQFPVILFSHGYVGSVPEVYTAFCEELASHGYIVVAIAHTYYAGNVTFPDGRNVPYLPEKFAQMKSDFYRSNDQEIWIADAQRVLDQLTNWNADPTNMFFNHFDMNRIGIFGHSFGGVIALQLCLKDSGVKAGISLDGVLFGKNVASSDVTKPFMFLVSEGSARAFDSSDEELAKKYSFDVQVMKDSRIEFEKMRLATSDNLSYHIIPNSNHNAFSDFSLLKELPLYKNNKIMEMMVGSAEGHETIQLINRSLVSFFDKQLKGI